MLRLRLCTLSTTGAGAAVLGREPDIDTLIPALVQPLNPFDAGMALRADRPVLLPLHPKGLQPEALSGPCLPAHVGPGRPEQLHAIVLLTRYQQLGVHVATIDDMRRRQPLLVFELRMDRAGDSAVGDWGSGGCDMRNQRRGVLLAGLREVRFVPDPAGAAFLGQVGIRVIRR